MTKTSIEWTTETWNPIVGCSVVSPGCTNCYAMKQAHRIQLMAKGGSHYDGTTKVVNGKPVWTGKMALSSDKNLTAPLRRKKPTTYFVNSMSDLFHEDVPDEWIDDVFGVMIRCPQHTFQVLTKRADRMRAYMARFKPDGLGWITPEGKPAYDSDVCLSEHNWPPRNIWLGVSAEDQKRADERIPDLLETPANVHFISAEPLLGPINFAKVPGFNRVNLSLHRWWVIVGGESGDGARPMHPDWARSIRDQCNSAGVDFFFKQWGNWLTLHADAPGIRFDGVETFVRFDSQEYRRDKVRIWPNGDASIDMGNKKAAGNLLDGWEHKAMPSISTQVETA